MDWLGAVNELQSEIAITAGAVTNLSVEMIKYKFSELDITELGILEAYLSKKFDESKPEYLLMDAESIKTLNKIKLKEGETISIKLLRNGAELPFVYMQPENMWRQKNDLALHELISLGFVKAYVQNPDIAKIIDNKITAISKGKSKLVLIYGTEYLECDINVK